MYVPEVLLIIMLCTVTIDLDNLVQGLTNENEGLTRRIKQLEERVDEEVARVHQLKEEKQLQRTEINELRVQCEGKTQEIRELQERLGVNKRHSSLPAQTLSQYVCSHYYITKCSFREIVHVLDVLQPTRANRPTLLKPESEKNFREREVSSVLQDLGVREKIGEVFNKVKGATGESCWRTFLFELLVLN